MLVIPVLMGCSCSPLHLEQEDLKGEALVCCIVNPQNPPCEWIPQPCRIPIHVKDFEHVPLNTTRYPVQTYSTFQYVVAGKGTMEEGVLGTYGSEHLSRVSEFNVLGEKGISVLYTCLINKKSWIIYQIPGFFLSDWEISQHFQYFSLPIGEAQANIDSSEAINQ